MKTMYVLYMGCVGNLPKVNMDIQYAQPVYLRLILHSQTMESKQKQLPDNDFNCRC
jgi:hypothetical protein